MRKFIDTDFKVAEDIYERDIVRIKTNNLPKYFALVSLLKQRTKLLGQEGGILVAHADSNVQINFPKGTIWNSYLSNMSNLI